MDDRPRFLFLSGSSMHSGRNRVHGGAWHGWTLTPPPKCPIVAADAHDPTSASGRGALLKLSFAQMTKVTSRKHQTR